MTDIPNKFRAEDRVVSPYGNKYKVKKYSRINQIWVYTVVDDSGNEMTYDEDKLKFLDLTPIKPKPIPEDQLPARCPICYSDWLRTVYGAYIWIDCKTCKKTAEEIMEEQEKLKSRSSSHMGYPKYY